MPDVERRAKKDGDTLLSADLCLVSCVSKKLPCPAPAKGLYVSQFFLKARAFVESRRWPWFILSAEHGLLHPDAVTAPYEKTLNKMRADARRAWANDVMHALEPHLAKEKTVVILAGEKYRKFLEPQLRTRGVQVCVPMAGLRIGEQLRWLNARLPP